MALKSKTQKNAKKCKIKVSDLNTLVRGSNFSLKKAMFYDRKKCVFLGNHCPKLISLIRSVRTRDKSLTDRVSIAGFRVERSNRQHNARGRGLRIKMYEHSTNNHFTRIGRYLIDNRTRFNLSRLHSVVLSFFFTSNIH